MALKIISLMKQVPLPSEMRMGADGYVFKPVTIEELEMAIRSASQRRRAVAAQ